MTRFPRLFGFAYWVDCSQSDCSCLDFRLASLLFSDSGATETWGYSSLSPRKYCLEVLGGAYCCLFIRRVTEVAIEDARIGLLHLNWDPFRSWLYSVLEQISLSLVWHLAIVEPWLACQSSQQIFDYSDLLLKEVGSAGLNWAAFDFEPQRSETC